MKLLILFVIASSFCEIFSKLNEDNAIENLYIDILVQRYMSLESALWNYIYNSADKTKDIIMKIQSEHNIFLSSGGLAEVINNNDYNSRFQDILNLTIFHNYRDEDPMVVALAEQSHGIIGSEAYMKSEMITNIYNRILSEDLFQYIRESNRRYDYINFDSGRHFGRHICPSRRYQISSWWNMFLMRCSYCFCYCDSHIDSDRYFSLQPAVSTIRKNNHAANDPDQVREELNRWMDLMNFILQQDEDYVQQALERVTKSNEEKDRQHKAHLEQKDAEISAKMKKLDLLNKDLAYLQNDLKQKHATIANMQTDIHGKSNLLEQQRQLLQNLMSASDSKAMQAQIDEECKRLKKESKNLDSDIESIQKKNHAARKKNQTILDKISELDIKNQKKLAEKDKVAAELIAEKELYKRREEKNHKLMKKLQSIEQQQEDELVQHKQEMTQYQENINSLKKKIADLDRQIATEKGDFDSPEQLISQLKADIEKVTNENVALENAINDETTAKTENEEKLSKLKQRLARLTKNTESESKEVNQSPRSRATARSLSRNLMPPPTTPRRRDDSRTSRGQRSNQPDAALPVVQRADSSVNTEMGESSSRRSEAEAEADRNMARLRLLKDWF